VQNPSHLPGLLKQKYEKELSASFKTLKLEDYPLSAVHDYVFLQLTSLSESYLFHQHPEGVFGLLFPVTTCDSAGNNRRCFVFISVGAVVNAVMNIQLRISQDLLINERILACE
jgi:hypothetical protein